MLKVQVYQWKTSPGARQPQSDKYSTFVHSSLSPGVAALVTLDTNKLIDGTTDKKFNSNVTCHMRVGSIRALDGGGKAASLSHEIALSSNGVTPENSGYHQNS